MKVAAPPYSPPVESPAPRAPAATAPAPRCRCARRRNQADGKRAQRHQDHGERQHFLAAVAITQRAEHQAAQRPHQERHGEGGERRDHLRGGIAGREEHLADGDGQIAVDTEVEPLHGIAECGGADGALEHGLVDDGDLIDLQVAAAFEPAEMGMCIGGVLHGGSLVEE
jgi:hypothetical protein